MPGPNKIRNQSEEDRAEVAFQAQMDIALEEDRIRRGTEARIRDERTVERAAARANPATRATPVSSTPGSSSGWVPSLAGSSGDLRPAKPPPIKAPPDESRRWTADGLRRRLARHPLSVFPTWARLQSLTSQHHLAVHWSLVLWVQVYPVASGPRRNS